MNKNGVVDNSYACNICGDNISTCNITKKFNYIIETTYEQYLNNTIEDFIYNTTIVNNFINQTMSIYNETIEVKI
jgi:hypothetical protein